MGTAGRTAPLRRTGSLLGLLGLEVAAVLGLHGLGRFAGLRIGWDEPVSWLLNSPIQNVLGSILRMVALVMAYWLLASTVAYLLASLTRLPGAVRAVGWATLPLVRRVADHAVAVTLATSMVGGTTLGVAGPALAADGRSFGPPAPKPVAAAQDGPTTTEPEPTRTSEPVYTPDPADQAPTTTTPRATPPPPTTEPEPTRTSKPVYTPDPADQAPRRVQEESTTMREAATTTTAGPTTTTEAATTTTEAATTTTAAATTTTAEPTTSRQEATTSTQAPTTTAATRPPTTTATPTTAAPPTAAPSTRQGTAAPTSASTTSTSTTRQPGAAGTTATTHAYTPEAASDPPEAAQANPGSTTTTNPGGGGNGGNGGNDQGPSDQGTGGQEEQSHRVVAGDNLWTIARDHLSRERSGGSGKPTNREVAAYWIKVVEANRDRLRSGDPDLIYPEEQITLPPVD
jgi:hypothetical protein